ncbi:MAG: hypothetical protein OXE05_10080 [Chloroflexi bacterium]|nr:hypothetical protein [Chloroflexota bacterium]
MYALPLVDFGTVPEDVGTVPEDVGTVPEDVGKVPKNAGRMPQDAGRTLEYCFTLGRLRQSNCGRRGQGASNLRRPNCSHENASERLHFGLAQPTNNACMKSAASV